MSDHIAHIGICDDTFRLARLHPGVPPRFRELFDSRADDAHMGSVTRGADHWSVDLIAWAAQQERLPAKERDPLAERKLAFVLGALTHRAADRLTKPITNCWKGRPDGEGDSGGGSGGSSGGDANESKIMQDILVWREVFAQGAGAGAGPFDPRVLGLLPTPAGREAEAVFRLLLRRALIAMHTLNPDSGHIHAWLDGFFRGLQTFPKRLEQYAALAQAWPADKVQRYLVDKRFYARDDELIRLARGIQRGEPATPQQVAAAAAATGQAQSRYARALAKALDYLVAAGDLYEGRIGPDQAAGRFDIGVPELALQD